jgi:hypothetical protein
MSMTILLDTLPTPLALQDARDEYERFTKALSEHTVNSLKLLGNAHSLCRRSRPELAGTQSEFLPSFLALAQRALEASEIRFLAAADMVRVPASFFGLPLFAVLLPERAWMAAVRRSRWSISSVTIASVSIMKKLYIKCETFWLVRSLFIEPLLLKMLFAANCLCNLQGPKTASGKRIVTSVMLARTKEAYIFYGIDTEFTCSCALPLLDSRAHSEKT